MDKIGVFNAQPRCELVPAASFAALTTQHLATGQAQTALTVTGVKGNLAVTAVKAGPAVTQAASAELIKLINTVLAHD